MDLKPPVTIKQLVQKLQEKYREENQPWQWLSGLSFAWHEAGLSIFFSNAYFAKWFMDIKKEAFLTIIKKIIGKNTPLKLELSDESFSGVNFSRQPEMPEKFPRPDEFMDNGQNAQPLAAARMVASNDPVINNVSLITYCGETGVGKTHLLANIRQWILDTGKDPISEDCLSFLKSSLIMLHIDSCPFWARHTAILLDNFQEILNEPNLQAKLVRLLNLTELMSFKTKSIRPRFIFCWQGNASQFRQLDMNLRLRLEKGMIFHLKHPDLTTRLQFVETYLKNYSLSASREQIIAITRQSQFLPVIQGFLGKLRFFFSINNRMPNESEFNSLLNNQNADCTWEKIVDKVCLKLSQDKKQLLNENRKPDVVYARQIAIYMCKIKLGLSCTELGKLFGGKDHSTILYGLSKIGKLKDTNKDTHILLTELEKELA